MKGDKNIFLLHFDHHQLLDFTIPYQSKSKSKSKSKSVFLCHSKPRYMETTTCHKNSIQKIATHCLILINWCLIVIRMGFVEYCEQAESIRDTCSRDPAHYGLNIWLWVDCFFFKKKTKVTVTWKKEKEHWRGDMYRGYPRVWSHAVIGGVLVT